jgi:hypothetical protein
MKPANRRTQSSYRAARHTLKDGMFRAGIDDFIAQKPKRQFLTEAVQRDYDDGWRHAEMTYGPRAASQPTAE